MMSIRNNVHSKIDAPQYLYKQGGADSQTRLLAIGNLGVIGARTIIDRPRLQIHGRNISAWQSRNGYPATIQNTTIIFHMTKNLLFESCRTENNIMKHTEV